MKSLVEFINEKLNDNQSFITEAFKSDLIREIHKLLVSRSKNGKNNEFGYNNDSDWKGLNNKVSSKTSNIAWDKIENKDVEKIEIDKFEDIEKLAKIDGDNNTIVFYFPSKEGYTIKWNKKLSNKKTGIDFSIGQHMMWLKTLGYDMGSFEQYFNMTVYIIKDADKYTVDKKEVNVDYRTDMREMEALMQKNENLKKYISQIIDKYKNNENHYLRKASKCMNDMIFIINFVANLNINIETLNEKFNFDGVLKGIFNDIDTWDKDGGNKGDYVEDYMKDLKYYEKQIKAIMKFITTGD